MKIHFCRSKGFTAWLIRTFTMSRWNHVAVEIDGIIWQATGIGVHVVPPDTLKRHYPVIESIPVDIPDKEAAKAFARSQLNKPYDFGAVFGMFFRVGWHDPDRWFCSEYVAAIIGAGGRKLRLPEHRVTPRDLWVAL